MRNKAALIYAVLTFIGTQAYFSRFEDTFAGFPVFILFAYVAFRLAQLTLDDWAAAMVDPIDHASIHARLTICLLAPLLVATILARVLYVVTGWHPIVASFLIAFPWLLMSNWTHSFLFPRSEESPPRGVFDVFIPSQFRHYIGG